MHDICTRPVQALAGLGQQFWLAAPAQDLARVIAENGVRGAVFGDATLAQVQQACDLLHPIYIDSNCRAGFVSVPMQAGADLAAAWRAIGRPNAMLQLRADEAGLAALEEVTFAGINTELRFAFTPRQLAAARAAQRRGLARRLEAKLSVQRIASVASMAVGALDDAIDALLPPSAAHLRGRAGIACARVAYRDWKNDANFAVFAAFGATPQWLAWSSSGSKDTVRKDLAYLQELIGADTIHTVPVDAIEAFAARGKARPSLQENVAQAQAVLAQLPPYGIDLDTIAKDLLNLLALPNEAGKITGFSGATL